MDTSPAFHLQNLVDPNPALAPDTGEGVPSGKVERELVPVPCSPDFDPNERRAYGGVMASTLAGLAVYMVALRLERGLGPYVRRLARMTKKVAHALYIYTRVKEVMEDLDAPEEIEIELNKHGQYVEPSGASVKRAGHTVPASETDWAAFKRARGYDIRGTSLKWVQSRARTVKARARKAARRAYIKDHGLEAAPVGSYRTTEGRNVPAVLSADEVREPMPMVLGEIWPPVAVPKSQAVITVVRVDVPRTDAFIASEGRKVGLDYFYQDFYGDEDNYSRMWDGVVNIWQRGPP